MTPDEATAATADAVSGVASHFMLDMATYQRGGELGFNGMDFYFAGRAGVLGDVDADVVSAAMVFFNPTVVRGGWDGSAAAMPRRDAGAAFASCGYAWADAHLGDDVDHARLATLAGRITAGASPAGAPIFANWRLLDTPTEPKAAALHQMNLLRELRAALHGAAVLAAGIAAEDAVRFRTPAMAPLFGWADPLDEATSSSLAPRWAEAEAATNRALAPAYAALDNAELDELVALANAEKAGIS